MINCAGKAGRNNVTQAYNSGGSHKSSKNKVPLPAQNNSMPESCINNKGESSGYYDQYLWFGPRGNGGRFLYWIIVLSCFIVTSFVHSNLLPHLLCLLSSLCYCSTLSFASFGFSGLSNLYPGDIIPFTRRPLFLIIDSDNSHAFKAGLSKLVHEYQGFVFCLQWSVVSKSHFSNFKNKWHLWL